MKIRLLLAGLLVSAACAACAPAVPDSPPASTTTTTTRADDVVCMSLDCPPVPTTGGGE